MSDPARASDRPLLKLLTAEDIESGAAQLTPGMRLSEFYWQWFVTNALDGEGKAHGTKVGYDGTVKLWCELTGDPPNFDQFTVSQFVKALHSYRFTRSRTRDGRVMPGAVWRQLSLDTIARHLRNVRAILHRMGPARVAGKATASILDRPPAVKVPKLQPEPKDCFEVSRAKLIVAAARSFDRPQLDGIAPWEFWRAYCAWLYVTDVREGTLWGFEWSMLVRKDDGWWLKLPRALVPKTGKGKWLGMPDWCVAAVQHWPRRLSADGSSPIFPRAYGKEWLRSLFYDLQTAAGVPTSEQLPPQAWRRTHAREMQRLGAGYAIEISRRSLDHGHSSTTTGHYADITEELRRRLPCLWEQRAEDPRQGLLFA